MDMCVHRPSKAPESENLRHKAFMFVHVLPHKQCILHTNVVSEIVQEHECLWDADTGVTIGQITITDPMRINRIEVLSWIIICFDNISKKRQIFQRKINWKHCGK